MLILPSMLLDFFDSSVLSFPKILKYYPSFYEYSKSSMLLSESIPEAEKLIFFFLIFAAFDLTIVNALSSYL